MSPVRAKDRGPSLDLIPTLKLEIFLAYSAVGHGLTHSPPMFSSSLVIRDSLVQILEFVAGALSVGVQSTDQSGTIGSTTYSYDS